MEIIYCSRCGKQIPPGGVEDGRYYIIAGEPACPDCYESLPPEEHTGATLAHLQKVEARRQDSSTLIPAAARRRRASSARMEPPVRRAGAGRVFGVAAGVLAALALVLGVIVWAASSPTRPPKCPAKPPRRPIRPAKPPPRQIRPAKPPAAGLERGLVAWWRMDGADPAGAADSSGRGNGGTLKGGPVRVDGRLGRALRLDGVDDYVDVAASKSLDVGGALTFAAWVRPAGSAFEWQCLMEYNDGTKFGAHFYLAGDAREADRRALFANLVDAGGDPHSGCSAAGSWMPGRWQHVAVTRQGAKVTFYLDGGKLGTSGDFGLGAGKRLQTGYRFQIGARVSDGKTYFFKGLVDDVRVYSRALSAGEVAKLAAMR